MKKETITCDICGREKQEVNHWWLFHAVHVLAESDYFNFEAKPWIPEEVDWNKHACGRECLTKAMNQWMEQAQTEMLKESK